MCFLWFRSMLTTNRLGHYEDRRIFASSQCSTFSIAVFLVSNPPKKERTHYFLLAGGDASHCLFTIHFHPTTMNINVSRHHHRESKHSNTLTAMESARCRISQRQPYSYSCVSTDCERPQTEDAVKSRSIPICKAALKRTASELKLTEDEATADFQDYVFFSRLLTGIARQQQESVSDKFIQESDECLAHIIGTRNGSYDNLQRVSSPSDFLGRASRHEEEKDDGIFPMDL